MSDLLDCPECGTTNNVFVNDERCYSCGAEWADHFVALSFSGP